MTHREKNNTQSQIEVTIIHEKMIVSCFTNCEKAVSISRNGQLLAWTDRSHEMSIILYEAEISIFVRCRGFGNRL